MLLFLRCVVLHVRSANSRWLPVLVLNTRPRRCAKKKSGDTAKRNGDVRDAAECVAAISVCLIAYQKSGANSRQQAETGAIESR